VAGVSTKLLFVVIAVALLLFAPLDRVRAAKEDSPTKKPDFGIFLTNDLRAGRLGILGHPIVKTPNLGGIFNTGHVFRNTYFQDSNAFAVCFPSRRMILSGGSYLRG